MLKTTDDESADLKQRLRTLPVTAELRAEAEAFPAEASEAIEEVERGLVEALPGSYVAITRETERDADHGVPAATVAPAPCKHYDEGLGDDTFVDQGDGSKLCTSCGLIVMADEARPCKACGRTVVKGAACGYDGRCSGCHGWRLDNPPDGRACICDVWTRAATMELSRALGLPTGSVYGPPS